MAEKKTKKGLGFSKPIRQDDPRLDGHVTTYRSSRGGFYPEESKPVPGQRKSGGRWGRRG